MGKTLLLSLPYLFIIGFVIIAQDAFTGFAAWNCLPVVLAFGALLVGLRRRGPRAAAFFTFSVISALLPALFHLAWMLDWGGTATGSSTSALAFLFVPVFAVGLAILSAAVVWAVAWCAHRQRSSH